MVPVRMGPVRGLMDVDNSEAPRFQSGFLKVADNLEFKEGAVMKRRGSWRRHVINFSHPLRIETFYRQPGEAGRLIVMMENGSLYDFSRGIPIKSWAPGTDFSMASFFGRAYISPHNGETGLPGEFVYVYDGSTFRKAGGTTGEYITRRNNSTVSSTSAGRITPGVRWYGIQARTPSGHWCKPTYLTRFRTTRSNGSQVTMSNLRMPRGTTYRLVATGLLTGALADIEDEGERFTYWIVPGTTGTSTEDADTNQSFTYDFYDIELLQNTEQQFDQLDEIPAMVNMGSYQNRLLGCAPNTSRSRLYMSRAGFPESFSDSSGWLLVDEAEGSGLQQAVEYRGSLLICKKGRSYMTQAQAGEPGTWSVTDVDSAVGTYPRGVARILDRPSGTTDRLILADRRGLLMFQGSFDMSLTQNIDRLWKTINWRAGHRVEVTLDPVNEHVFVAIPTGDATRPNLVLHGDYTDGFDQIKWSKWTFPSDPACLGTQFNNEKLEMLVGQSGCVCGLGDIVEVDAHGQQINSKLETGYIASPNDGDVMQLKKIFVRASNQGTGNLENQKITIKPKGRMTGTENTYTKDLPRDWRTVRLLADDWGEQLSIEIGTNTGSNARWGVNSISALVGRKWGDLPR